MAFALMRTRRAGCYKRVWEVLAEKTLAVTNKVLLSKILTWFTLLKVWRIRGRSSRGIVDMKR
jgi:hypothetical protein